jgi:hypothetical protein
MPRETADAAIEVNAVVDPPLAPPDASMAFVIFARRIKGQPPAFDNQAVAFATWIDPSTLDDSCIAKRGCDSFPFMVAPRAITPRAVSRCPPEVRDATSVDELLSTADSLAGRVVHVRGPIGIGSIGTSLVECAKGSCCNGVSGTVVLVGSGRGTVALDRFRCIGDDSGLCCDAPAYGETVVATGRLADNGSLPPYRQWGLTDATLCVEAPRP